MKLGCGWPCVRAALAIIIARQWQPNNCSNVASSVLVSETKFCCLWQLISLALFLAPTSEPDFRRVEELRKRRVWSKEIIRLPNRCQQMATLTLDQGSERSIPRTTISRGSSDKKQTAAGERISRTRSSQPRSGRGSIAVGQRERVGLA